MKLIIKTPKVALNKALLKHRPLRSKINLFKENLKKLLNNIDEIEREENQKTHVRDFLRDTYYKDSNEINTKDNKDLVIHLGKTNKDKVGVIIEAKRPSNKGEMISAETPNTKALHELVLYYLRERIHERNIDVKFLIATNIYEWFVIEASYFDKVFYKNKSFVKDYEDWHAGRKINKTTDLFYNEIAKPFIQNSDEEIPCVYFNLRDYEANLYNRDFADDKDLIALFKVLSPFHLLKVPFADDSNSLNKPFYDELLHIIGLEEIREKNKTIIQRKDILRRSAGSLLENAITILKTKDSLRKIEDLENYGDTTEYRYFNVALELCITWINRFLFLKLLEAQLINYHKGDRDYRFLNIETIPGFGEVFTLFHQVLAKTYQDRVGYIEEKYKRIPYLNSSLFEISELEDLTISVESLKDNVPLQFIKTTVLKEFRAQNKTLTTLEYLFRFLDAYDFASEGVEDIQEDNRSLINASVLGKVFEKINGYKDGSVFTPGFVTMYMCRQTIRRAIVQKFKNQYGIDIESFDDLRNYVGNFYKTGKILEFNEVINSIRLCDPAVGSGHFLVSSLNEILAIKSELGLLANDKGARLSDFDIDVENDELIITDERGDIFEYQIQGGKPTPKAQTFQKALFHEKQKLIENCLFGVDINPNSVKICRLRLWIELLKNAYYKESTSFTELETLPNIDINIKCGNSLLSRFALDTDLKEVLKQVQYDIEDYRSFVQNYKKTRNGKKKRDFEAKITQIKKDLKIQLNHQSPERVALVDLENQLRASESKQFLFGEEDKAKSIRLEKEKGLKTRIEKAREKIKQIEENIIYRNAFEWRFEFPEVLDNDGNFLGFDVIIGNPPYVFGGNEGIPNTHKQYFRQRYITGLGKINLFNLFIERAKQISKQNAKFSFIIPNTFLRVTSYDESRKFLINNFEIHEIADFGDKVFDGIVTTAIVLIATADNQSENKVICISDGFSIVNRISRNSIENNNYVISLGITPEKEKLIKKIKEKSDPLGEICQELIFGVVITKNKKLIVSDTQIDGWKPFLEGGEIEPYYVKPVKQFLNYEPKLIHRARTIDVFEAKEKLLIQRITGGKRPIKVAYDNNQLYNKESINNLILKENTEFSIKYVLAILNSKLIDWFYAVQFTNQSNLTVNLSKMYLSQIPIKRISPEEQQPFIELVDEILERKKLEQETFELENEIDRLVFKLYELTGNEIAIVEEDLQD